jgi:hypothetical protein
LTAHPQSNIPYIFVVAKTAETSETEMSRVELYERIVRHEAPVAPGGMREPTFGLSQQVVEVGGSPSLDAQVRVGAALTTPGRVGTARRLGPGQRDGKVYECRNQRWNPLKRITGSNLVDVGRVAAHDRVVDGRLRTSLDMGMGGGHEESLRRTRGDAVGEELGAAPVDRLL